MDLIVYLQLDSISSKYFNIIKSQNKWSSKTESIKIADYLSTSI